MLNAIETHLHLEKKIPRPRSHESKATDNLSAKYSCNQNMA